MRLGASSVVDGPSGPVPLYTTYQEWKEGPYPEEGWQCQDCHMPSHEGPAAAVFSPLQKQVMAFTDDVVANVRAGDAWMNRSVGDQLWDVDEADVVMTIRSEYRQKTPMVREAEERAMPIYVLKTNTIPQMQSSLTSIFALEIDPRDAALRETEEAIGLVINRAEAIELSPQNAYIRRLQHQMAERANLVSRSRGREPYRRVRLYPDAAKTAWR